MVPKDLSHRLRMLDASFLYYEKPQEPMHIGFCLIYEGHLSRDEVIPALGNRLHLLPRYRQKVVFPPLGLAYPTWEDDPDFDLSNHVKEVRLRAPGDDRVLSEVGGYEFASQLERHQPLWNLVLLHGRPDGNTAMIWKIHHAMADGLSGLDLMRVAHDRKSDAKPPTPRPWQPQPIPGSFTLLQEALRDQLTEARQWWTDNLSQLLQPADTWERARRMNNAARTAIQALLRSAPHTPFNGRLSGERRFAWVEFSFPEIRSIGSVLGGTVNDVGLAVIAGGLGRYLRAHEYQTEGMELRALCPVSMRREDEHGTFGNKISMMLAPLYVSIADPVQRLAATRAAMGQLKSQAQASGFYAWTSLLQWVPPVWQAMAGQVAAPNLFLNTVSSNMAGPQMPLYLAGHKLLALSFIGALAANVGLFNGIVSYNQKLAMSATVDPKLMPDAWYYMDCLKESFTELLEAAK